MWAHGARESAAPTLRLHALWSCGRRGFERGARPPETGGVAAHEGTGHRPGERHKPACHAHDELASLDYGKLHCMNPDGSVSVDHIQVEVNVP